MTVDGFQTRLAGAQEWRESPWGRLRHALVGANLARHLGPAPLRVLDVAGGHGPDAVRLAVRGHEVTVLDPAGVMLALAKETACDRGVADRVHVVQASAEDVPEVFGAPVFDVVLCHNLVQYADDRGALLRAVSAPLRPGGLISVLSPEADPDPVLAEIRRLDLRRALRGLDLGLADRAGPTCTAEDLLADLGELGATVVGRYDVRCVHDYEPPGDGQGVDRMPYLLTASYFHLVARL